MLKEKSCGALVYRRLHSDIQILLIRHRLGGHWSFPKGHVELGETEEETALREVKEETGLNVVLDSSYRRTVTYSPRQGVTKDVVYFLAYAEDSRTRPQEEEVSGIMWVDLDKAHKHITYDNDKLLLPSASEALKGLMVN